MLCLGVTHNDYYVINHWWANLFTRTICFIHSCAFSLSLFPKQINKLYIIYNIWICCFPSFFLFFLCWYGYAVTVFPSFRRHSKNMSNYSVENAMSRGFSIEHNAFNVELDKFGVFNLWIALIWCWVWYFLIVKISFILFTNWNIVNIKFLSLVSIVHLDGSNMQLSHRPYGPYLMNWHVTNLVDRLWSARVERITSWVKAWLIGT